MNSLYFPFKHIEKRTHARELDDTIHQILCTNLAVYQFTLRYTTFGTANLMSIAAKMRNALFQFNTTIINLTRWSYTCHFIYSANIYYNFIKSYELHVHKEYLDLKCLCCLKHKGTIIQLNIKV